MTRTELITPRYWSKWRVEDQPLQRMRRGRPPAAESVRCTASSSSAHALARLGADAEDLPGGDAEHLLDLAGVALGVGGRQVDLVERGDDLEVVLEGQEAVGQRLCLDALRRVDEQDDALARRQRARHLVAEVDVARRVDQVDHVVAVVQPHRLELDGDAPLPLQVHRVEVLRAHVPGIDRPADLEDPVGQRGLAVVDVGDDRDVAQPGPVHGSHATLSGDRGRSSRPACAPRHRNRRCASGAVRPLPCSIRCAVLASRRISASAVQAPRTTDAGPHTWPTSRARSSATGRTRSAASGTRPCARSSRPG